VGGKWGALNAAARSSPGTPPYSFPLWIIHQSCNSELWVLMNEVEGTWNLVVVARLVEALPYKPEGRGFDSRRCH